MGSQRHPENPLDHYTLRTYIIPMHTFIELQPFATVRDKYLNDDEFTAFQHYLAANPDAGDVIPRSGGAVNYDGHLMDVEKEVECGSFISCASTQDKLCWLQCMQRMCRKTLIPTC